MTHSGATQFVEIARSRLLARMRAPGAGWRRAAETVWGPLLTLAALIVIDQLARHGMPVLYPFPPLLLTVVISAYLGGFRPALISAVLTVLYGVHFFAEPGLPLRYQPDRGVQSAGGGAGSSRHRGPGLPASLGGGARPAG